MGEKFRYDQLSREEVDYLLVSIHVGDGILGILGRINETRKQQHMKAASIDVIDNYVKLVHGYLESVDWDVEKARTILDHHLPQGSAFH